jgi:hypothetical protein
MKFIAQSMALRIFIRKEKASFWIIRQVHELIHRTVMVEAPFD